MEHNAGNTNPRIVALLAFLLILFSLDGAQPAKAQGQAYHHIVILGDPHLPGKNIESKERVIETINSWDDVEMVVAVGDICKDRGSSEEYAEAKRFFSKLKKPLCPIAGNHDFIYDDLPGSSGTRKRSTPFIRDAKLSKFKETFGLPSIYYTGKMGKYFLVFLSTDSSDHLAEMSGKQLEWFSMELEKNMKAPTIAFFHAPLKGTLRDYNKNANTPGFIAQPSARIHDIIIKNPQLFLWVSGHTHTSPKEESFALSVNIYEKRVTNIHNPDMDREAIYTNSLFLYPDKVIVKTYDHGKGTWLPSLERTISVPPL